MPAVRLRPLRPEDEDAARAAHEELARDDFEFCLGLHRATAWAEHLGVPSSWDGYLAMLEAQHRGDKVDDGLVPATFLAAVVGDDLVGRTSIRHRLNDFLEHEGGHIGYGVRPGWRRRGVATAILEQSLVVARALGLDRVLLTCDDDNGGSATVIERCGGRLENVVASRVDGRRVRRYWID